MVGSAHDGVCMSVPACGLNCVSAGQGGSEDIVFAGGWGHGACCAGVGEV